MGKFTPQYPFHLYKDGTYQGKPSKTTEFIGDIVRRQIEMGGIPVCVYRFMGSSEQKAKLNGTKKTPYDTISAGTFMQIQDTVLLETRDRLFNVDDIPIMYGVYQVSQFELEYAKFGALLSNEALTMEFHVGTMEQQLGRRMIEGDVVELPHLKDIALDGRIQKKLFEVTKVVFSPSGYDPTYGRHVMGVIIRPLKHQQEFLQLMDMRDEYGKTLAEQNSQLKVLMDITEANQQTAAAYVPTTGQDRGLMWVDPADTNATPNLFTDSITPPNGYVAIGQGDSFPPDVADGSWFIRTDMVPARLYRLSGSRWLKFSEDNKREWIPYNWVVKAREFMSDRSLADKNREYDLVGPHDVLTDRESTSDPTYGGDRRTDRKDE